MSTELHAAASTTPLVFVPLPGPVPGISASVGPTATGEVWSVDMAQIQINLQYGDKPLVVQQVEAQALGTTTAPPPPVAAQVWLSAGGINMHLLAQTSQGGYDNVGLGGQQVRAGEAITVVWWLAGPFGAAVQTRGWFVVRGTRETLSVE
jgi:hypothetical protein